MAYKHDEDIKIASNRPSQDIRQESEQLALDKEYSHQKESGNLDLAENLGRVFARQVCGFEVSGNCNGQDRVLFAFAAVSAIEAGMNRLCGISALSGFYNYLMETDREFYDKLDKAFSFYYLSLRKGLDVERKIGTNFAMLCENENNARFADRGAEMYREFLSGFAQKIDESEFSD